MNSKLTISDTDYIAIKKGEWDGRKETIKRAWRGKYVILCMKEKMLPNGNRICIPACTVNVGKYGMTTTFGQTKQSRNAVTVYKTEASAKRGLIAFINGSSVRDWFGVKINSGDPFKTTRSSRYDESNPYMMFKLIKMEDYIPEGPRDAFRRIVDEWWVSEEGKKFKDDNPEKVRKLEVDRERARELTIRIQKRRKQLSEIDANAADVSIEKSTTLNIEKRDRRFKMFQAKFNMRFVIRDERSKHFLQIPQDGSRFELVDNLKDSTYFKTMGEANDVAMSIDRSSYVSEYATWRLKVHTVTFKNPKFNANANADEGED